jgi:hypothetical protein
MGYVQTLEKLRQTLRKFARHLVPAGIVVLEPWCSPRAWKTGSVPAVFVDEPELKIARINISARKRWQQRS